MQELTRVNVFFNHHMPNPDNVTYYNVPKKVKIEYSEDGVKWTTGNETSVLSGAGLPTSRDTQAVPKSDTTLYAWEQEGLYYNYPVDPDQSSVQARYVRVSFPGGGQNGSPIDVLEVQAFSSRDLTALGSIKLDPKVDADGRTAAIDVAGSSFLGQPIDLGDANLAFASDDPSVAEVGADGVVSAAGKGRTRINVTVELDGYRASDHFYVDVDASGQLSLPAFLKEVKLSLNKSDIKKNEPIVGAVEGTLSTGEKANLSKATVAYKFSDDRLENVPGSNTIVLKEPIAGTFQATAEAVVTLDGVEVPSNREAIVARSTNIANQANVTVSSVRDRNGVPDGNNQDDRYLGKKAIDGSKATSWAAKKADRTPWIKLDFPTAVEIDRINLIDRGGSDDRIVEGVLEWEGGSKRVTDIQWDGQPDNVVTLDVPVKTSWVKFTIDPDGKYENPTGAESGLAEFEVYEAQKVTSIVDFKTVAVDTKVGVVPTLPAQTEAVYSNGTTRSVDVTWDPISEGMVANEGCFTVAGAVADTSVKARAVVTVIDE